MNILKSFSSYTLSSFINKGMMFAIIPFLADVLPPEQNGLLSLYGVVVMFVMPFALLGFPNTVVLEYSKLDKREYASFFSSSLVLSLISFVLIFSIFLFGKSFFSGLVGIPSRMIVLGMAFVLGNLFFEGLLSYLRAKEKPFLFVTVSVIKNMMELGLIFWLVFGIRMGAEGRVLSGVIAGMVFILVAIYFFYKEQLFTVRIQKKYILAEMNFGFSQLFFQINLLVFSSADKYLIDYLLHDKKGLGVYFVASQFAFIINVLVTSFFFSFQPLLYNILANFTPENKLKLLRIKYLFTGFLLVATLLLCICSPLFYKFFIKNQVYHDGIAYIPWLAFSFFFWGIYALFLGYLYYYRKNKVVLIFSIMSILFCLISTYLFIRYWGIMGAAWANLFTYFILSVAMFFTVKRYCKLELPWLDLKNIFRRPNVTYNR